MYRFLHSRWTKHTKGFHKHFLIAPVLHYADNNSSLKPSHNQKNLCKSANKYYIRFKTIMVKNFNKRTFIISTILFGLLLIPCFIAAWAEEEGSQGTNFIWLFFAKLFYILRFPTHTLLWKVFSNGTIIYFVGLIVNLCLYGFLTERLIFFIKRSGTKPSVGKR